MKAKLHGFTHPHTETEAVYKTSTDEDLYATAVSNYFKGNHAKSIENLENLIKKNPLNPFYKELVGEIYFVNSDYNKAVSYQLSAIEEIEKQMIYTS